MSHFIEHVSFIIPCTQEQAEIALRALCGISGELDEDATDAISKPESDDLDAEERIVRHCYFNHSEQSCTNDVTELEWRFVAEKNPAGIWVYSTDSFNPSDASVFSQAVLRAFDLPDLVEINVAHISTRLRVNCCGGSAFAVTKDTIRELCTTDFLYQERLAVLGKERYFIGKVAEVNGGYQHQSQFIYKVVGEQCQDARFREIMLAFHDEGRVSGDDADMVTFPGGISAVKVSLEELPPNDFMAMAQYLPVH